MPSRTDSRIPTVEFLTMTKMFCKKVKSADFDLCFVHFFRHCFTLSDVVTIA